MLIIFVLIALAYAIRFIFKKKLLNKLYSEPYQSDSYVNITNLIFFLDVSLIFLIMFTALILTVILF